MANQKKKKKSNLPAKRSHHLSAPAKRKSYKRRNRGMGDIMSPTMWMNGLKTTAAGAGGGFGAMIVNKSILPSDSGKLVKLGTGLGGSLVLCLMNMPNVAAGFAGGMTAISFPNGLLGEDDNANFADEDSLNESTVFLDDDGDAMMLHEDPETGSVGWRYLTEEELAEFEENMEEN